ncbi:AI-2E family transporter [Amylibacter marinus]|uniref:AI-2E family transporter n=1 Tax=Amylibacter marinus TaxID=1475483 RepID=A0ABQ5VU87_9RHOB|nr:AI-2E family transporter [Amylibacter marinus]GLQ34966.1 AI-2E family transporter [Amylibacter marinus]
MALSVSTQFRYWAIGLTVAVFLLWLLGGILLPFVTGMAIAYFLDPVADRLEAMKFSRVAATTIITLVSIFVALPVLAYVLSQMIEQLVALIAALPEYFSSAKEFLIAKFPALLDEQSSVRGAFDSFVNLVTARSGDLANAVLASAFSVVDAIIFIVVAPVVAFYMLLDWDRMVATIDGWLPRDHRETLRALARELDGVMAGFVRGQLTVCAILGGFYAITLMAVGLQFGLIVGLIAGMLTFIPYVGSLIGGGLSLGLALFQFWGTPEWIVVVAIIFVIGQVVEGNFLTPKLVGGSVGLHPVWLMFALSAFGSLMGFTGMLVAVPVAAGIGVFSRFGIRQYLNSRLYNGLIGLNNGDDSEPILESDPNPDDQERDG